MFDTRRVLLLALPLALLAADRSWKDKQVAEWTAEDARQVLSDSPWAKPVAPTLAARSSPDQRGSRGGMGRLGGIGISIPGIGIGTGGAGGGGGRPGGLGGGGYPREGEDPRPDSDARPPTLVVRWESALPIREAELKAGETNAPDIDQAHFAILVLGLPAHMARDPRMSETNLKGQAKLELDGKTFAKPSSVRILSREEGTAVLYLFKKSKEVTAKNKQMEFGARLGRLELEQAFDLSEMVYNGRLEL